MTISPQMVKTRQYKGKILPIARRLNTTLSDRKLVDCFRLETLAWV